MRCPRLRQNHLPTCIPLPYHHSLIANQPPSQRPHFFAADEMADQSGSPRFQTLFESALQAYEKETGVTLAQHPLAQRLQSCHASQNIITLLQGQVQAFDRFRRDKIVNTIKASVSILTPLSAAAFLPAAESDTFGLVRPEALMALFHFSDHFF
jgi:hypothetical protein